MYSGFITSTRSSKALGVHQRFDTAALRLIAPYLTAGEFPTRLQILAFEGVDGPDGLKVKSPGVNEPGHLYDPQTGAGDIPGLITTHYKALVKQLRKGDLVRAGFEAGWLAHFITDGLTPAHHFEVKERQVRRKGELHTKWVIIGASENTMSTHFNFELGVAAAIVGYRIRAKLDPAKLAEARQLGVIPFFKKEAAEISEWKMYETFYKKRWTVALGRQTRTRLAPKIVQAIAIIWLLAYLDAGYQTLAEEPA